VASKLGLPRGVLRPDVARFGREFRPFPILYLAALGIGVGHLVAHHHGVVDGQTYLHYIAPSLLATTTMQLGEGESLWPSWPV